MSPNTLPGRAIRAWGLSNSMAFPSSMTSTRSLSRMVLMRWAMVRVVTPFRSRSVAWISRSVWWSTEAVASSSSRILQSHSRARTMHTSCRWPTLRFCPLGSMVMSSPPLRLSTNSLSLASARVAQSLSDVCRSNGSKLNRRVPEKSTGSCGMMAMRHRSACSPTLEVGRPSMRICPSFSSTSRSSVTRSELLPAPVRPTIPTFSPGATLKLRPLRTGSRPSRYCMTTFLNSTFPAVGHSSVCGSDSRASGGSGGRSAKALRRSRATRLVSAVVKPKMMPLRCVVRFRAYDSDRPSVPASAAFSLPALCAMTATTATPRMMTLATICRRILSQQPRTAW
mmetsp:Transcript_63643/g.106163  ORF Transcript_63643/g.106163 Transcript_63643/m.106163 type:complete len:339 (-) Transcript_63643:3074-4090(-)